MPQLAVGQATPNPANPPHVGKVPPPRDQEQFLSYWTAEPGWSSELQLRNNAPAQDLQITPVLRLPDGAETMLAPVTVKPQEVQSIDLETAITNSAPQLIGSWGSVVSATVRPLPRAYMPQ